MYQTAAGCLACLIMLCSFRLLFVPSVHAADDRCTTLAAEIAEAQSGGNSLQNWLDGTLSQNAGQSSADSYLIALAAQGGYDLSGYAAALQSALAKDTPASATSKERMALTLAACKTPAPQICTDILNANAESLGVMSRVYGLHLLNNGVASGKYTNGMLIAQLTDMQCSDGGWAVSGSYGDPDVTAMVLQALAPYQAEPSVQNIIADGVAFLSAKQRPSGAFQSYGVENAESTAQVWLALSCLGVDALRDARFVKNGNSLLDGISQFRIGSGVYTHAAGGTASAPATVQVYLALTAAQCSHSLYLFHGASPKLTPAETSVTTQSTVSTASTASGSSLSQTQSTGRLTNTDQTVQTEASETETETTTAQACDITVSVTQTISETAASGSGSAEKNDSSDTVLLTTAPPDTAQESTGSKYPYRTPLTAAAAAGFGILAVVCFLRGKRSVKTYLTIIAGFGIVTAVIWCIRLESPEQYYRTQTRTDGTVTMEIRCDAILGLDGSEQFPADGILMQKTEFSIDENESALELLYDAVKAYQLQVEVDGVSGDVIETAYVRSIGSLYEFAFGDLSGWTYTVNGVKPSVGCGAYTLSDGDEVAWVYTIEP